MSGPARLAGGPGDRLDQPRPVATRRAGRRRAAVWLGLLVTAGLAVVLATGAMDRPGGGALSAVTEPPAWRRPGVEAAARPARSPARARASGHATAATSTGDRVVAATNAPALFARHTWYVRPPPPPPPAKAPAPPPPEPTAPPFPYSFVGSYTPEGGRAVFFLAHGDRVVDAHVGDRLDGVYQLESAAGGQLVFVYLPLNLRQNLAAGVSR